MTVESKQNYLPVRLHELCVSPPEPLQQPAMVCQYMRVVLRVQVDDDIQARRHHGEPSVRHAQIEYEVGSLLQPPRHLLPTQKLLVITVDEEAAEVGQHLHHVHQHTFVAGTKRAQRLVKEVAGMNI